MKGLKSLSKGFLIYDLSLDLVSTKFYYFKIVPPASPYIIIPQGGSIIYELAGGNIFKTRNVVDPNIYTSAL